jgi:DNA-binding transcriptional LysR family regulator
MDFRISQLQGFLALADHLHYRDASRSLDVSRPTLNFRITSLEESLRVQLFERTKQGLRLTRAGSDFRGYAQRIADTVGKAQQCMDEFCSVPKLRITICSMEQSIRVASILRALVTEYPTLELEILEMTIDAQAKALLDGTLDAVLMSPNLQVPGLQFDPICTEHLQALVSTESLLAERPTISVQDLRYTSVITSHSADSTFTPSLLTRLFAPFGVVPTIVETTRRALQFRYAASGMGIIVSTGSAHPDQYSKLTARLFLEELPRMELGLLSMKGEQTAVMKFLRNTIVRGQKPTALDVAVPALVAETHDSAHL